jgi:hypothetical protein
MAGLPWIVVLDDPEGPKTLLKAKRCALPLPLQPM